MLMPSKSLSDTSIKAVMTVWPALSRNDEFSFYFFKNIFQSIVIWVYSGIVRQCCALFSGIGLYYQRTAEELEAKQDGMAWLCGDLELVAYGEHCLLLNIRVFFTKPVLNIIAISCISQIKTSGWDRAVRCYLDTTKYWLPPSGCRPGATSN